MQETVSDICSIYPLYKENIWFFKKFII
jgi:hypothetical protein